MRHQPIARACALVLYGCGAALFAPVGASMAQTPADEDEVVVTAQRREERLQDVPISAQVVGQAQLTQQNITSLEDVATIAPSVALAPAGRTSSMFVRGVGSGQNQSFDQSVGIFVDDIYHGRSRMTSATFLDLNHVEILRGPQTTYFGNNAIAGALNIVTQAPSEDFSAWARALYGEHGQYVAEGAVGGPIAPHLSARAALTFNGSDGWIDNVAIGETAPEQQNRAGRIALRFAPNPDFDATLKVEASRNQSNDGLVLQTVGCPPPAPFTAAGFCSVALALGLPTGLSGNENAESSGERSDLDTFENVLTMNYDVGGSTLTSVTGYYGYDFALFLDTDGTPLSLLHVSAPEQYSQFSQEFRIASPVGRTIDYIAGLYYQSDELEFAQDFTYGFLDPVISTTPGFEDLIPFLPLAQQTAFAQTQDTYSVFGAITWNVSERLRLAAGLRWSAVEKDYDWRLFYASGTEDFGGLEPLPTSIATLPDFLGTGTSGQHSGRRRDEAFMPSARLEYDFTPSVMGYISYNRGFKAGGFNGTDNSAIAANIPFDPEYVDAYEAGLKGEYFDRRLVLNVAVFRSEYSDLQVTVNQATPAGTFVSFVRNAAASVSQGVELGGHFRVSDNWVLSGNLTYLDAHYVSYPDAGPTQAQRLVGESVQDLSGRPTAHAPRWAGDLSLNYSTGIGSGFTFDAELSGFFSSGFYLLGNGAIDPLQRQESYVRLDGRLTLATADRHWAFDIIARNINDEDIVTSSAEIPLSLGSVFQTKEEPRNIAAQIRYRW